MQGPKNFGIIHGVFLTFALDFNLQYITICRIPQPGQRFQYHCADHQCYERSILLSDLKENSAGI